MAFCILLSSFREDRHRNVEVRSSNFNSFIKGEETGFGEVLETIGSRGLEESEELEELEEPKGTKRNWKNRRN